MSAQSKAIEYRFRQDSAHLPDPTEERPAMTTTDRNQRARPKRGRRADQVDDHIEAMLDAALEESFPASDPPAICSSDSDDAGSRENTAPRRDQSVDTGKDRRAGSKPR